MKMKQWKTIGISIAAMLMTAVLSGCQTSGAHPFTTMFEKNDPLEVVQAMHEFSVPATAADSDVVTAMHEKTAGCETPSEIQ